MRYQLVPEEVSELCTLAEALHWMAMRLYPRDMNRSVFGRSYFDEHNLALFRADEFRDFAAAAGLGLPSALDTLLAGSEVPSGARHDASPDRDWDTVVDDFNELLEPSRAELYLLLRRGLLIGTGVRTGIFREDSGSKWWKDLENLVEIEPQGTADEYLEPVPAEHWSQENIDWLSGVAIGSNGRYESISIPFGDIVARFPEPDVKPLHVQKRGSALIVETDVPTTSKETRRPARGRPREYDWDAFVRQVIVIANTERLPEKQDALVKQMLDWCQQNWGNEPAISTVKKYLQPIYQALKKADNSQP